MLGVPKRKRYRNISKSPKYNIEYGKHFLDSMNERGFELSILVPLYLHVANSMNDLPRGEDMEYTTGKTTIVYTVLLDNSIKLITGWVGNRKKEMVA